MYFLIAIVQTGTALTGRYCHASSYTCAQNADPNWVTNCEQTNGVVENARTCQCNTVVCDHTGGFHYCFESQAWCGKHVMCDFSDKSSGNHFIPSNGCQLRQSITVPAGSEMSIGGNAGAALC
jgi:hypothetical protein